MIYTRVYTRIYIKLYNQIYNQLYKMLYIQTHKKIKFPTREIYIKKQCINSIYEL